MKRFPYPIIWSIFASLALLSPFVFETSSRAESDAQPRKKISADILKKASEGKGAEFVRVVIQPAY